MPAPGFFSAPVARDVATLAIADLHHHVDEVENLIRRFAGVHEQVVFLGDTFDDFDDTPEMMTATCRWLMRSLQKPHRIHLLGNHDLAYFAPGNPRLSCPGWTVAKQQIFDCECTGLPRDRCALAIRVGPWLLSHAGVSASIAAGRDADAIADESHRVLRTALEGHSTPWLAIGRARGGRDRHGGVTWQDWNEEFRPVSGLHQIVGHTPLTGVVRGCHLAEDGAVVRSTIAARGNPPPSGPRPDPGQTGWLSVNWCVDCHQQLAVLLTPERIEFLRPYS